MIRSSSRVRKVGGNRTIVQRAPGRTGGGLDITRLGGAYAATGYQSVIWANTEGRAGTQASGAAHGLYDREKLINQSRQFLRNNGIYRGMIERAVSYIVGNGFGLQAKTRSARYNNQVEALWTKYWRRPEVRGILAGRRLERMVGQELLVCGDASVLKIKGGLLQQIEAEQLVDKKHKDGIQKTDEGKPKKFYVSGYTKAGRLNKGQARAIDPADYIFVTAPERPSSTRGVPPCQASFAMLHRINDVCDSEAVAWQMLARLAIAINRKDGAELAYDESRTDPDKTTGTDGDLSTRLTELDYALIFHGDVGEEVKGIERNLPGKNFGESLIMFLRLLGLPLGLPLEVILLDWTKSNYSQSRAVLEQAYQSFLGWQLLLEDLWLDEVYAWKVAEWVKAGKLAQRADGQEHLWIRPTFPWIDQLKEAQAQSAKLDRGMTTHAAVCRSLNVDRGDVVRQREIEIREAIAIAQKISTDTGEPVPWQIFAGLAAPSSSPAPMVAEAAGEDDDEKTKAVPE